MKRIAIALAGMAGMAVLSGCAGSAHDKHLNQAYQAYDNGDCSRVMGELSRAERSSRSRPYLQPEISLLRGLCLERQALFLDAAQTYRFILRQYPSSEYSYRASARLETLRLLGHYDPEQPLAPEKHLRVMSGAEQ